jgi:hypothetical protein
VDATIIDITFMPSLNLVSVVRKFVLTLTEGHLKDPEAASRVEIATHEILENAVRHSSGGVTRLLVEISPSGGETTAVIRTWNRAKPEDVEVLRGTLDDMQQASDAQQYFLLRLQSAVKRVEASGLGLARAWAEAGVSVRHSFQEGQVNVTAKVVVAAA